MTFLISGASIVVASPNGGVTPIDPKTAPNEKQHLDWGVAIDALQRTEVLANAGTDFDALFIPGGHGPMIDLAVDPAIQALLTQFDEEGKIIGAVCHGPAALLNAKRSDGEWFVAGRRVCAFTNTEETLAGLGTVVPFLLESALKERGAQFDGTPIPFAPHVIRDGNLITGQNPASSQAIADRILEAMSAIA
jgi:putative intracellular protease/amidase